MIKSERRLLILYYQFKDVARYHDRPHLMPQPTFPGLADWLDGICADPKLYADAVKRATCMFGGDEAVMARQGEGNAK